MPATARPITPELVTGLRLSREEFLRTWDRMPDLKHAELIDGVVYVASPVGIDHGDHNSIIDGWLMFYAAHTRGCRSSNNATWLMLASAPQPDSCVYLEHSLRLHRKLAVGRPELAVELSDSSYSHDYGPKLALYQQAGVPEYLTFDVVLRKVVWRRLVSGSYQHLSTKDGIFRSRALPGLWLDADALWRKDNAAILRTLQDGLATPEHAKFAAKLSKRR